MDVKFNLNHIAMVSGITRYEIELEEEIYCEDLKDSFSLLVLNVYDNRCELYEGFYDSYDVGYDVGHLLDPISVLFECIRQHINEPAPDVSEEYQEYLEGDIDD